MTPPPLNLDPAMLQPWMGALLWTLARVGGLCLTAPVLGAAVVPGRIRTGLAVLLALVLLPVAPTSLADPLSGAGVAAMAGQLLLGALLGFVLQLTFEAVSFGGQVVSQSMNLGIAEVLNPAAGANVPVLSQFYNAIIMLLFLALDGHLRLIALLADSFRLLPLGVDPVSAGGLHAVLAFAGELFAGAVRVALPALTSLLVVNLGFAAISRAAPAMNLFAVGFPITLTLGMVVLWLALRSLPGAFASLQDGAWTLMRQLVGG